MIWIIGGTKETKDIIERIEDNYEYIVTTATYSGKEMLIGKNVAVGKMDLNEMINFIKKNSINKIIDISHPYAFEVTSNAREAAKVCDVEYFRYIREKSNIKEAVYVNSIVECIKLLKNIKGNVFFTTGMKNIKDFEKIKGNNRFIYRVLPALYSIQECVKNKVSIKDIVAILGPVSEEMNIAMFKTFKADYVVMKDSGVEGGCFEKIKACLRLDIKAIIIGRKEEEGFNDINELMKEVLC